MPDRQQSVKPNIALLSEDENTDSDQNQKHVWKKKQTQLIKHNVTNCKSEAYFTKIYSLNKYKIQLLTATNFFEVLSLEQSLAESERLISQY